MYKMTSVYVRDALSKRRLTSGGRKVGSADEHLHADGAVVDLDAVE